MIRIGKKQYELFCSIRALENIGGRCGGIAHLGDWMTEEKDNIKKLGRFAAVIADLVNGDIERQEVENGEKLPRMKAETITALMTPGNIMAQKDAIFEAIAEASRFDSGEDEEDEETVDLDLEEIRAEKNGLSAGA